MTTTTPAEENPEIDWGNDRLIRAQRAVEANIYDVDSWSLLIREAQTRPIQEVRSMYEKLIAAFPTTGRFWKIFIEQEMKARNFERVEKLFQRCLMKILNIELWRLYLNYVKETKCMLPTYKEKMAQAYDFALDKIGLDIHAYPIWNDYITFLKSVDAVGSYAENQKISAVRKVYQRAVITPIIGIETLWKDYIAFEQSINTIIVYFKNSFELSWNMSARDCCVSNRLSKEVARGATASARAQRREQVTHAPPQSRYHVFVAAALMEYYCSKDKNIAFRIFELGLKKFSHIPEYVLCYIDYLSHLNEDNNTRVLFERVLSSGSLSPESSVDIWNRFLEFESNIGDLLSIVKVEKRRQAVLEKIKEFEGKETAQLVDRYKFLDLYPCSIAELKSIGYTEVASMSNKSWALGGPLANVSPELAAVILGQKDHDPNKDILRPDTNQMIPYKPKSNPLPGEHPIPGGTFPVPPAAAHLCTLMPPPSSYRGPFVAVDRLMQLFNRISLPDKPPPPTQENGCDTKLFDLARSVHWIVDDDGITTISNKARRRKAGEDSDDDDLGVAPPVNDIYRQRQQKRVK
ncbi:protein suppressor of forked [Hyposmocoma kahamanoa]|uniref:protein suppressor of forked n=1 Tax=Hyposmocoma kahamanoa TaxID=1477025 RepID=UPI000E6D9D55|nr:protein suppressor of forked [Hyposmocoma kahamanoa]